MKQIFGTEIPGRMKLLVYIFLLVFTIGCDPKKNIAEDKFAKIPFLHESKGTKNYEVVNLDGGPITYDSIRKFFLIESLKKYYKYSINGKLIDSMNSDKVLIVEDPNTFKKLGGDYNSYSTWFENGDKAIRGFIDIIPFQRENRDSVVYKKKHLEFYNKASIVRYTNNNIPYYYYYYNNNWYRMTGWGDAWIKKHYPEKLPPPRLKDIRIDGRPTFLKQTYVVTKNVKSNNDALGAPKSFSMGTYIIRIGLPGGDSLVYKRLGDGLGNLTEFYQLPTSRGGNDSILFIRQEYNNQDEYFSHGGLFMVRPKTKK
ncbi:MAG: hypothetical protein LBE92_05430 [Chryseobacterium sp.]|jgi:hypothetical protein|uniref:hypothetical protein n=1 Tax=Chryseobacterium sp. TaxID=1871047 RepID=UPI0028274593|nr:hypothetical protein [Chryseobacterium sp.]MDR2235543.1 hypothetical protein [Chryseobacterium sp.]